MNEQQTQNNADQKQVSQMPKLDYAKLNGLLNRAQGQNAPAQVGTATQQQSQQQVLSQGQNQVQGQQHPAASANPDVVTAQEEFKNIKDGDTYTDENGQEWVWNVMDYVVVPEEVKDEEVDNLNIGEGEEVSGDESDLGNDAQGVEGEDGGAVAGEGEDESDAETIVVQDEADKILQDAINEVLGIKAKVAIAQDGNPWAPDERKITRLPETKPLVRGLTAKRQGYETDDPDEIAAIAPTQWKRGRVSVNGQKVYDPSEVKPGQTVKNASYMVPADKRAMENAHLSHRRPVAATWEKCRAKDKSRCPYHGAAYMTDKLGEIIAKNGIQGAKYGILMHDPETAQNKGKNEPVPYRILFALPKGVSDDVRKNIMKEFFDKNPNIIFNSATAKLFGKYENNTVFSVKNSELNEDDLPIDAPTQEDFEARHDTAKEQEYSERAKARGAVSWTSVDTLGTFRYFNMLSERPTNIVECNEDMLRYAKEFSEYLPEGMSLDDVNAAYKAFMDANAAKKGLQAFLMHGETVDKAEALAAAAEQGLEGEYQKYLDASEQSLEMAQDIFRNVQDNLYGQYAKFKQEALSLPNGNAVLGEETGGKTSVYFGSKYDSKNGVFPLNVGGEDEELLRQAAFDYKKLWNTAARNFDYIQQGCEMREPMMVMYGIRRLEKTISALKEAGAVIGDIQDAIVEAQDPRWLKRHGISVPGTEGKTAEGENPSEAQAEKPLKGAGKKDKKSKKDKIEVAPEQKDAVAEVGKESEVEKPKEEEAKVAPEERKGETSAANETPAAEEENKEEAQDVKEEPPQEPVAKEESKKDIEKQGEDNLASAKPEKKRKFTPEEEEEIKDLLRKNKSFMALNKKRTEMYQTFGADSQQFKDADVKAKDALRKVVEEYLKSKGESASSAPQQGQQSEPSTQEQDQTPGSQKQENINAGENGTPDNGQTQTQDPAKTVEKQPQKKPAPKSSVVRMARGEGQQETGNVNADASNETTQGASNSGQESKPSKGVEIIRGIQLPDNPTVEDAAKINEQFANLEKRIRGLARVYGASYTEEDDYRAAEQEIDEVKAEIDSLMKSAKGKGYFWTKDSPKYSESGSTSRPKDLPINFRISGIRGANGETVSVPYKEPAAKEIDLPESKAQATRTAAKAQIDANQKKPAVPFKKKADYSEDYAAITDKVGEIGSVYGHKTLDDLILDGFRISVPFRRKDNGAMEWVIGMPDESESIGISRSKDNPPIPLSVLFAKRFGGDPSDETALRHFVEAIRAEIKKMHSFD